MSDTRPNVLLITVDQWPGQMLGCAGHPTVLTPTLDQLARNGIRYTNAYAETPICIPARRTLMTGTGVYKSIRSIQRKPGYREGRK